MSVVYVVLLLFMLVAAPLCLCNGVAGPTSCIESERRALLDIKAGLHGIDNWLSSWSSDGDCCRWSGVGCNNATGHVVKLNLRRSISIYTVQAPSKLNPSLAELTHLQHLDLSVNNLSGVVIPKYIGSLVHLTYLNLSYTNLGGSVPHQLGNLSRLHVLDLQQQSFPYLSSDNLHWLSRLSSLQLLDMSGVDLSLATGWLQDINMLPSLSVLRLLGARLHSIPAFLPRLNLTSLATLDLSSSGFLFTNATSMPYWLFNITSLEHLDLNSCGLSGKIPNAIQNLGRLRYLNLGNNMLSGELPKSLWNMTHLTQLDLSYNGGITGSIADTLGHLLHMESLDLSYNMIHGEIPDTFGNMTHLTQLHLSYNGGITGSIPDTVGHLLHMEYLDLSFNMIHGEIPDTLGNMTHLTILDLSFNRGITGEIPKSIGGLSKLVFMDLSSNQIRGMLPDTIENLSFLEELYISDNMMNGELPYTLGNLFSLQTLDLTNNMMNGELPYTLGNLSSLQILDLSNNSISGEIPLPMGKLCNLNDLTLDHNNISGEITWLIDGLSNCTQNKQLSNASQETSDDNGIGLSDLDLSYNKLNGRVPQSLGQLSMLTEIDLGSNSLTGALTEAHFANLTNLQSLDLSYNSLELIVGEEWVPPFRARHLYLSTCQLGRKFPMWLQTQETLDTLDVSETGISDCVPSWIWSFNLSNLNMSHNQMRGPMPKLGPSIYFADLSSNSFSGPIPRDLGTGLGLQILYVSDNHLNGSIPTSICKMSNLKVLRLFNNNLSGRFPDCQSKSSKPSTATESSNFFTNLQSLNLRNNSLTGTFPSVLKYCGSLTTLDLSENGLSGKIPTWIGDNMYSLQVLVLRSNNFRGSIPSQLSRLIFLQVVDLSHNNLSGSLPRFFWNFTGMLEVHQASGSTPFEKQMINGSRMFYDESILVDTKGTMREYTKLLTIVTCIDVSANNLSGEISEGVVNLHGLRSLNMSKNHFKGKIPEKIGALQQLESLDLSENNLSGQIPTSISTIYSLSRLNLSNNNLSGKIPSGNQLQTLDDPSIYSGNVGLCGWPLQTCNVSGRPSPEALQRRRDEEDERYEDKLAIIWIYASSAVGFIVGFWGLISTMMLKRAIRFAYFRCIDRVCDWFYVKLAVMCNRWKSVKTN